MAARTPATSEVIPVSVSVWTSKIALIMIGIGSEPFFDGIGINGLAPIVLHDFIFDAKFTSKVTPTKRETARFGIKTFSPISKVLVSAASQLP